MRRHGRRIQPNRLVRQPSTGGQAKAGGFLPTAGQHRTVLDGALNQSGLSGNNQLQGGRQKREVFQPHRTNAGHYRVGQPNQALSFSRGWGKGKRAAPPTARGCSNQGGRGGNPPLTPNLTKPVQGMEVDGAPGTTSRVPPLVCKNEGVRGVTPP